MKENKEDKDDLEQEGNKVFQSASFSNAVNMIKENYITYLHQIILYNKLRKAKYDSLIECGFDEDFAKRIIIEVDLFK